MKHVRVEPLLFFNNFLSCVSFRKQFYIPIPELLVLCSWREKVNHMLSLVVDLPIKLETNGVLSAPATFTVLCCVIWDQHDTAFAHVKLLYNCISFHKCAITDFLLCPEMPKSSRRFISIWYLDRQGENRILKLDISRSNITATMCV